MYVHIHIYAHIYVYISEHSRTQTNSRGRHHAAALAAFRSWGSCNCSKKTEVGVGGEGGWVSVCSLSGCEAGSSLTKQTLQSWRPPNNRCAARTDMLYAQVSLGKKKFRCNGTAGLGRPWSLGLAWQLTTATPSGQRHWVGYQDNFTDP